MNNILILYSTTDGHTLTISKRIANYLKTNSNISVIPLINCTKDDLNNNIGATITEDVVDTRTGEIFIEGGAELTSENIESLKEAGIQEISIVDTNKDFHSMLLINTIEKDPTNNTEEALGVVYQLIRSSEPPNLETAQKFIERIFFSPKKYDLGQV